MLKLTKNKYGPFEGISKADFNAKRSEYTDPTKYDYYYDDDDERYYVSKITRISKEFEKTDTKNIEEFKKYAQNLVEENIDKEIKENVKVKKM